MTRQRRDFETLWNQLILKVPRLMRGGFEKHKGAAWEVFLQITLDVYKFFEQSGKSA